MASMKSIIFALRLCAGIFVAGGLAFYVVIYAKVTDDRFPGSGTGLTALPIGGAAGSVLWNIIALATATIARPVWFAMGDFVVAVALTALGSVGLRHDTVTYLSNGMYLQYDNEPWLIQEIAGGSFLLISVLLQLLLVLLSVWGDRRLKKVAKIEAAPPYTYGAGPYMFDRKKGEKDVDVDWKSVVSQESLVDSVRRPDATKV